MTPYKTFDLSSPIHAYEYGKGWIRVQFVDGDIRTYRYSDSGWLNVRRMIRYAKNGKNLATFIMNNKNKFKPKGILAWFF